MWENIMKLKLVDAVLLLIGVVITFLLLAYLTATAMKFFKDRFSINIAIGMLLYASCGVMICLALFNKGAWEFPLLIGAGLLLTSVCVVNIKKAGIVYGFAACLVEVLFVLSFVSVLIGFLASRKHRHCIRA